MHIDINITDPKPLMWIVGMIITASLVKHFAHSMGKLVPKQPKKTH